MAPGTTEPPAPRVDAQAFLDVLRPLLDQVVERNAQGVQDAAALVAAAVQADGLVQAFGTGHSEALAMEVAGRAGGLVPTNRIALRDIVIHGGADPSVLADGTIERDPALAARLYELAAPVAGRRLRGRLELGRQRLHRRDGPAGDASTGTRSSRSPRSPRPTRCRPATRRA